MVRVFPRLSSTCTVKGCESPKTRLALEWTRSRVAAAPRISSRRSKVESSGSTNVAPWEIASLRFNPARASDEWKVPSASNEARRMESYRGGRLPRLRAQPPQRPRCDLRTETPPPPPAGDSPPRRRVRVPRRRLLRNKQHREPRARECTKTKVRPKFELIESGGPYLPATAHKYIQLRPHSINTLRRLEVPAATAGP